ncbi:MAG: ATP-binding protein [bacterium]
MKTNRILDNTLSTHFTTFKQALILLGARQVGKTTILKKLFPNALYLLVDEKPVQDILETYNIDTYRTIIGDTKQLFIDELHLLSNPGRAVKILVDQIPDIQIIVTGSSSLHIKNKTAESMAGRAIHYQLYPLTFGEYLHQQNIDTPYTYIHQKILQNNAKKTIKTYNAQQILQHCLLYGLYPQANTPPQAKTYLQNLAEQAIFKDIIELNLIDNRAKAMELLKLLAYQIGNLISYSELSRTLQISSPTVQRYIEIFEQSFILFRLYPYTNNARDEIGKAPKIYFWDLGLRNAIINNFENIPLRIDAGAMFENFIISELKKEIAYLDLDYTLHYWRLKSGSEVDLVLSNNKKIIGCEIKFHQGKIAKAFLNRYPQAQTHVITADNFL